MYPDQKAHALSSLGDLRALSAPLSPHGGGLLGARAAGSDRRGTDTHTHAFGEVLYPVSCRVSRANSRVVRSLSFVPSKPLRSWGTCTDHLCSQASYRSSPLYS